MQFSSLFATAAALLLAGRGGATAETTHGSAHPVEKVIVLLKEMAAKVKKEGGEEEVTYAKFAKWCTDSKSTLTKAITDGKANIESLEELLEGKTREKEALSEHIKQLEAEITKYEAADTDAAKIRKDQGNAFKKADKEMADTIKAIGEAITALEKAQKETSASALAQTKFVAVMRLPTVLGQLTDEQRGALLAAGPKEDILATGKAAAADKKKYVFKSGKVVDLLKELKLKFEDDKTAGQKAETASLNAYDLAKDARKSALDAAKKTKTEKEKLKGEAESAIGKAQGDLKNAREDLKSDTKAMTDTKKSCDMKKMEWEERSKLREREIEAMEAGIEILAKVTGVRTKKPTNPTPPPSPISSAASFLQLDDPRAKAVNLLREEARRVRSRSFARFVDRLAARADGPFDEVNNMIQKMIFRLMAEQNDEDDHKNWCDLELQKSKTNKADKDDKVASLEAKIKDAKATVQLLGGEIVAANKMVKDIAAHMEKATAIRKVGSDENKAAIRDARDAQAAIAKAQTVLLSFYKDSGAVPKEAWELLQRGVVLPPEPSTWGSSYTGVADPKNQPDGIITVLKTISADFATMEADTMAQEETDKKAYEEEMKSSSIEKARRAKESEMKEQEKKRLMDKVASHEKSLKHAEEELGAVTQYIKDLQPACVQGDSTYEDRKKARTAEIDSLKKAQVLLADWKKPKAKSSSFRQVDRFLSPVRHH